MELNRSYVSIEEGETFNLSATVCPANASNKSLDWCSSNTSVATVTQSGLVMAQGAGTATITATAQDGSGKVGYCYVTANAPVSVTGIGVYPTSKTMNVGETFTLVANVCPENATNKSVIWSKVLQL